MRIEAAPLIMNAGITCFYIWKGDEVGHIIYWLGATVLVGGLYLMRG